MNWNAYRALVLESRRQGLPVTYRSDLIKHDKADLRKVDAPERFVWILRKFGTWMATDWYKLFDRNVLLYDHGSEPVHYYVWDGDLREVTQLEAINAMRMWRNPDAKPYADMEDANWWYRAFWCDRQSEADMIAARVGRKRWRLAPRIRFMRSSITHTEENLMATNMATATRLTDSENVQMRWEGTKLVIEIETDETKVEPSLSGSGKSYVYASTRGNLSVGHQFTLGLNFYKKAGR